MGGVVPLGYRVEARALHVVDEHAQVVRAIFARFRELGSVTALHADLDRSSACIPIRMDGKGQQKGGKPFSRGHLSQLLSNPIYVGRLAHKSRVHDGQHAEIVDAQTWDAVQAKLAGNTRAKRQARLASAHLLAGRIRDAEGRPVTPTHAQKGSARYRYS